MGLWSLHTVEVGSPVLRRILLNDYARVNWRLFDSVIVISFQAPLKLSTWQGCVVQSQAIIHAKFGWGLERIHNWCLSQPITIFTGMFLSYLAVSASCNCSIRDRVCFMLFDFLLHATMLIWLFLIPDVGNSSYDVRYSSRYRVCYFDRLLSISRSWKLGLISFLFKANRSTFHCLRHPVEVIPSSPGNKQQHMV